MLIKPYSETGWDLWRDGVTQSFINSFMTCRKQCYLSYVEGWVPKEQSFYFEFGHTIHYVLSRAYSQAQPPNPGMLLAYIREYEEIREKQRRRENSAVDYAQSELIYGIAEAVLPKYFQKYNSDWLNNWVLNETAFDVPYAFADGTKTKVRGRFDGGFITPGNRLWLIDTKCLSFIDEEAIASVLPLDTQVMVYLWASRELIRRHNSGTRLPNFAGDPKREFIVKECPDGIIYNIIRRPGQRRKKDESLKDFCQRVTEEIKKDMDHYFIRLSVPITRTELDNWEREQFRPLMFEIRRWFERGFPSYLNPGALITKYGRCGLFDLITKGDRSKYYKRSMAFTELHDEENTLDL